LADLQRANTELQRRLDGALAERDEVEAQKAAMAEVLGVINSSPGDLSPVFEAMLEKALRLCDAAFGILFVREGLQFRGAATCNLPLFASVASQMNDLSKVRGLHSGRPVLQHSPAGFAGLVDGDHYFGSHQTPRWSREDSNRRDRRWDIRALTHDLAIRRWKAQSAAFLPRVCVKRTSGPSGSPMSAQCSTSWFQLSGTLIVGSFSQGWEFVT
jgi:hypothetical protein